MREKKFVECKQCGKKIEQKRKTQYFCPGGLCRQRYWGKRNVRTPVELLEKTIEYVPNSLKKEIRKLIK